MLVGTQETLQSGCVGIVADGAVGFAEVVATMGPAERPILIVAVEAEPRGGLHEKMPVRRTVGKMAALAVAVFDRGVHHGAGGPLFDLRVAAATEGRHR
jgi:hypothetical protein